MDNELYKIFSENLARVSSKKDQETLEFNNLLDIIKNLKMGHIVTKENAERFFNSIDVNHTGKISIDDAFKDLEKNKTKNANYALAFTKLCNYYSTKSEIVIERLAKISKYFDDKKEVELKNDVNWIIQAVVDGDMYEPVLNSLSTNKEEEELYGLLPSIESKKNKLKDIQNVSLSEDKHKTLTFNLINQANNLDSNNPEENISGLLRATSKVRESVCLSRLINTKLELSHLLSDVNSFEFDIFKMSTEVGLESLKVLTKHIFSKKDYFAHLISPSTFNFFIKEVCDGYHRTNPYHNDLHAADVLQTVFVLLSKGQLEEVS